jgi:hypothetical protein
VGVSAHRGILDGGVLAQAPLGADLVIDPQAEALFRRQRGRGLRGRSKAKAVASEPTLRRQCEIVPRRLQMRVWPRCEARLVR